MRYFTETELKAYERKYINPITESRNRKYRATKKIFLSHSHKDADLVKAAIAFFLSQGIEIYVDWLDPDMPSITSAATASKIKDKIKENHKFVVLLSSNAKDSKWVPWELGYADGVKSMSDIAILPILRSSHDTFKGVEYMDLYPKIGLDGIGYSQRTVIEKDTTKIYSRSLNEGWINKSNVIF